MLTAPLLLLCAALLVFGLFLGQYISSSPGQAPLIIAAATAMFFLTVLKPDIALFFLIFAMLLSPEVTIASLPKRNVVIRVEDLLIVVMGLAWIARSAIRKGVDLIPSTPVNGWIGAYCLCFLVATSQGIISGDVNPLKALFYILKYLEYYIIFFIVVGLAYSKKQYRIYLAAFFITFMIVNIFAVSQIGQVDRVSAPFEGETGEPNTLGGYQVFMICLALGLFCHLRSRAARLTLVGISIFAIWPFMHTLSRASFMAIVPAYLALIFYARSRRRGWLVLVFVAAVILAAWFLPESVKERLMYTFNARPQETIKPAEIFGLTLDPSSSARWWDWIKAFEYWMKQPFFGYGIAGKSFLDSQYINNLIETGTFGFLAFAGLIWNLQRHVLRVYRSSEDELVRGLALGFLAGNIGMLFHALTANTFIIIRIMEPYWFLAGMILASSKVPGVMKAVAAPQPAADKKPLLPERRSRRNIGMLLRRADHRGGADAT